MFRREPQARAVGEGMGVLRGGGGNAPNRSSKRHEQDIRCLRRKWGQWLDVVQAKGSTRLVLRVKR